MNYEYLCSTVYSRLAAALSHLSDVDRQGLADGVDLHALARCVVFRDEAVAHRDEFDFLFDDEYAFQLLCCSECQIEPNRPAQNEAELLAQLVQVVLETPSLAMLREVTDALLRVQQDYGTDTGRYVKPLREKERRLSRTSAPSRRQPTDADICEAVRRCPGLLTFYAGWAIVYCVLFEKFQEERPLSKFEEDMNTLAVEQGLEKRCPANTIFSQFNSYPWMRKQFKEWPSPKKRRQAEEFEKSLNAVLAELS